MKNEQAENLLNSLVSGDITPEEFKRLAQRPRAAVLYFDEPGEGVTAIIDAVMQDMSPEQFQAFRKTYPDIEYIKVSFYE